MGFAGKKQYKRSDLELLQKCRYNSLHLEVYISVKTFQHSSAIFEATGYCNRGITLCVNIMVILNYHSYYIAESNIHLNN